ncbi:hypothetical protein SynBIOSE41_00851 [Synechococcus sp. BIOS-E4-1]|uniref:hypothetical protein n=1 Tax=Synechococcus sp. BIOS-E4-1 TaxID=1400864 RepID=UPI0016481E95|nr:hypothetical protein [Synechococcus sp. BIOS-E4-1]QNI53383.1 hypothetical protein SynBIOSE41_00851 [Synechococcus sp. BIOS-E4-1]
MSDSIFNDKQLQLLASIYVSNLVQAQPVNVLLQVCTSALLQNYQDLNSYDLKDRIVSEANIETWNNLVERLKSIEAAAAQDTATEAEADEAPAVAAT